MVNSGTHAASCTVGSYHVSVDESIFEVGIAGDELLSEEGTVPHAGEEGCVDGGCWRRVREMDFGYLCHVGGLR